MSVKLNLSSRTLWIVSVLFLSLSSAAILWRDHLVGQLTLIQKEYKMDVALSKQTGEQKQKYEEVRQLMQAPEEKTIPVNTWVQQTQSLVSKQNLNMQELKPASGAEKNKGKSQLDLSVAGSMQNLFGFLYQIAAAKNVVYVSRVSISSSSDNAEEIKADLVLNQL